MNITLDMSTDKPTSRFVAAHNALRKSKILGDVGLGAGIGLIVACAMYFVGATEPTLGIPTWLVFGGGAFTAGFAISATLGLMPDANETA